MPNQLTQFARPYLTDSRVRYDALYAQDQWTRGKVTVQGAIRYDHAWSYYPEQQIGPTQFIPEALVFPESKGVIGYHDISPRFGLAYDVFGNGKTAVEVQHGPVPRSRGQRQRKLLGVAAEQPRPNKRHAVVDRRQRQLHPRLRFAER